MFLRISRADRFDTLPDMIVACARNIGAPRMVDPAGAQLELINVSHSQLQDYDRELRRVASEDPAFGRRSEVGQLVEGLNRCSRLIIVSTGKEVLLVSDSHDSKWQYEYLERLQVPALRPYDDYKTACTEIVAGLPHLPT